MFSGDGDLPWITSPPRSALPTLLMMGLGAFVYPQHLREQLSTEKLDPLCTEHK